MLDRRTFVLGALALGGCASAPPSPPPGGPSLTLDRAFLGRKTGAGVFRVYLTGSERRFTAKLNGTLSRQGSRLTVVEDFLYDDGDENRLTWVFDRAGPGRWTGRRDDTVGIATAVEANGEVRLTYIADFKSPSGVTRLGFADVIYARADGVIVNDAVVSRGGFPVGTVRFELKG